MKICPVCKSRCFDDMDTCYGCMHKFKDEKSKKIDWSKDLVPEYFELDSCPIVEDVESFYERKTQIVEAKKSETQPIKNIEEKEENIVLKIEIPTRILKENLK